MVETRFTKRDKRLPRHAQTSWCSLCQAPMAIRPGSGQYLDESEIVRSRARVGLRVRLGCDHVKRLVTTPDFAEILIGENIESKEESWK